MPFRSVFHSQTISLHALKKRNMPFILVLACLLCLSLSPVASGFIVFEHQDFKNMGTLIKKVHDDHWVIHYTYADDCPPEQRNNGAALTAGISKALRTWLHPLREYTDRPLVSDFRYRQSADFDAGDLGITFHCHLASSHAHIGIVNEVNEDTPFINLHTGDTRVTRVFMQILVHEVGHTFGLQDTYILSREEGKILDTGGLDETKGAQPSSVMSGHVPLLTPDNFRENAELHGVNPLGADDINGIIWLYKHIYEGHPLKDCFFQDYELVDFPPGGCEPKYPLIFELKYGGATKHAEHYAHRIIAEDEGLDVNAQDADGMTALHYAVRHELSTVVEKLLVQRGIKPFLRDAQGRSALQHARENDLHAMVTLLLTHPLTLPVRPKGKLATTWGHLKQQY